MNKKNIIIVIICLTIIVGGIAVWRAKGFYKELQYSSRQQIQLGNSTSVDIKDIEEIYTEVMGNETRHFIQEVEVFGNSVSIVSETMTDEQKEQIVEKFNEKYSGELEAEKVLLISIGSTRVKDVLKHYILPTGIITMIVVLVYFLIRYKMIDRKEVMLKTLGFPIIAELIMFSLIAIVIIPFGRIAVAVGVGLYVAIIAGITKYFEDKMNRLQDEAER